MLMTQDWIAKCLIECPFLRVRQLTSDANISFLHQLTFSNFRRDFAAIGALPAAIGRFVVEMSTGDFYCRVMNIGPNSFVELTIV